MDLDYPDSENRVLCRLCAKESEIFFDIFGEQGIRWKIASVVSSHFSFKLSNDDEYSRICHTCWWKIETFHIYYLEIQEAQKFFHSLPQSLADPPEKKCDDDNALCIVVELPLESEAKMDASYENYDYVCDEEVMNENIQNIDTTSQINAELQNDAVGTPTSIICKSDYESEPLFDKTPAPLNKSQPKRKREKPEVLAEDDLIRNWCEMQCTKCPELFHNFTFKDVKVHYHQVHDMNGFLLCCEKKFFRRVRALEHIARHINPNVFSCEKCKKTFSDKPSLFNHLDGHVSPDQRQYKCNSCDYSFVRRYQLSQHQKLRHFLDEKKFICEKCSKSFITKSILQSHIRGVHSNNTVLMCDMCAKTFKSKQCLQQHLLEHNGVGTAKVQCNICSACCEKCKKTFSDKPSLFNHLDGHVSPDQRQYKCNSCDYSFVRRYQLSQHQKLRHFLDEKKFICEKCSKSFITKSILQSHIRGVHSNNTVLMCDMCAKTFKSKQCLQQHLLEHNGVGTAKVQCNICSAWLKHQNSLRGHMARHLDSLSNHICNECGKKAPSRGALRSHQKYVHNPNTKLYPCNLCAKSFKKPLTLKEHMASCHTGEVLYKCPSCTKTFNSSANLCSHKKRVHPTNVGLST